MRDLGQLLAGQVTLRPSAAPARVPAFAVRLGGVWLAASEDWSYAPGGRCVLLSARLLSAIGQ
jgi:hypothetical protein